MPGTVSVLCAVLVAVLMWWGGTGVVLLLDGVSRPIHRWSLRLGSLLALAALALMHRSAAVAAPWAAYAGFASAIVVWGWQELAFLTGNLTGPRRAPPTPGAGRWQLFVEAVGVLLWHELAIALGALVVLAIVHDEPNQVALWTYAVLWAMRTSAKLNLHLGVRNPGLELLPAHLAYLSGYFRVRAFNGFLPLAMAAALAVLSRLIGLALDPSMDAGQAIGLVLVASLLALAILEHLMLVLPFSPAAPWRWALRGAPASPPPPAP
jgi:putative photosynthetic complex assembly protein 2